MSHRVFTSTIEILIYCSQSTSGKYFTLTNSLKPLKTGL